MKSSNQLTPMIVGAIAVAVIAGIGGYAFVSESKTATTSVNASSTSSDTLLTTSTPETDTSATSTTSSAANFTYKDGTYTSTTNYSVPKGYQNSITVTIVVKDNAIVSVDTSHDYTDRESGMYIDSFDSEISSTVVGVALDEARASRVGGASITTDAFTDALQVIVSDATA